MNLEPTKKTNPESGKLGAAVLMWFLGVPGFIIILYLLFAH